MSTGNRPNVVFILIDDMGWTDIACNGSSFYETPHLDRLARESMRFTDAYAACPVCSPTRASILTGRYPARIGITDYIGANTRGRLISAPYVWHLPRFETTIASVLRTAGYRTWQVGKWHLGPEPFWPEHHGFDVNIAGCGWGHPHSYISPYGNNPRLADGPAGEYLTDRLTDEAIRLLETRDERPFFLYWSHYAVHTPIVVKKGSEEKYIEKAHTLGLDRERVLIEGEYFPCEHKRDRRVTRRVVQSDPAYAAMVENLDWNIGRFLQALRDSGQADNTVVVFTSDNGGLATAESSPTCNAPLAEGKGWMYEGGTREPLLVRWPGRIPAGAICDAPVTSPDFFPTFLEMAGLDPRPDLHCDGVSLMPLLAGGRRLDRESIYWHYPHYGNQGGTPGCSMRMGDYKLIEFFEDNHAELYNLREDIGEDRDLAGDDPRRVAEMRRMLADWRIQVGARVPRPNPGFRPR